MFHEAFAPQSHFTSDVFVVVGVDALCCLFDLHRPVAFLCWRSKASNLIQLILGDLET